ncbi:hypothetical protein DFJ75_3694 [Williamsia muralis]|uniref:Uncharacterized protein n=1 Tax=Williamsia marianensis TaxID=85044 RepID=A0A495K8F5_WILMA|nr:hypothetical protein [Williamsia muralis]RKR96834.1 hypothetical protein DFJ75_3694 [Williamsia muralis]
MSEEAVVIVIAVVQFACGWIAAELAARKDRSFAAFFFVGALLGLIGIVIAAAVTGTPAAPPGMKAVTCPRCNARQNIERNRSTFDCWQCKTHITVNSAKAKPTTGKREDWREWLGKD